MICKLCKSNNTHLIYERDVEDVTYQDYFCEDCEKHSIYQKVEVRE